MNLRRHLPENATARSALLGAISFAALLLVTQVVLPGSPGTAGRGTPPGILFDGVVSGLVISLTAAGVVLVYRAMRILNFAQTALGVMGANLIFGLVQFTEVPFPISMALGLALATAIGAGAGLVTLRFFRASRLVLTVVSIVAAGFIVSFSYEIYKLPFFPDYDSLTAEQQTGSAPIQEMLPFPGWHFDVGIVRDFGFVHVFAIEAAVICLLGLMAFFRYTRAGVAVRALAENPERASLLGIGVGGLTIITWAIAGFLSGVSTSLNGMLTVPAAAGGFAPSLLLVAFAAAVIGRMESIPVTVMAAVGIATLNRAFTWSYPGDRGLVPVILFFVLGAALLVQRSSISRAESSAVGWAATEEQRAIPKVLADLGAVRGVRYGLYLLGLIAVTVVPFVGSTGVVNLSSVIALSAVVVVSIVVLTGWGGQVSLGQWAFAAVGAVVAGALTATAGLSFWLAVPAAAAVSGAVAIAVGLPALRIKGLFLLVITMSFAFAIESALFQDRYFGWLLPDSAIERPSLFFFDFVDETSMYFLCVATLVLSIVIVGNLRRSRTGRILIALRENDANVQSFGVAVLRTKLVAFAISGALAGMAGAVFVHQQQGLNVQSFTSQKSIDAFVTAVFGGVGSVAGALLGATYFALVRYFFSSALFLAVVVSGGALYILIAFPGGLISLLNAARDSVLRVIAQRRQIPVPSLFADYDAEALERRLIPLAEPDTGAGLGALPPGEGYVLGSALYRGRGRRLAPSSPASREAG
ncbi:MAG: ABC transporter permease [Actinomycetota bacterium]